MSVTLTGLVRISKTRYRCKDLSLKKLLFVNLYLLSRGLSIFLGESGRLKVRCVMRQNLNNAWASNESSFETWKPSLEFGETSFCYIRHSKGFWETIYFLRIITMTTYTYRESTDQQHLHVQFLGDKKGQMKGFYLEDSRTDSVFLYQVYLLNYQLWTVYIFVKVCIYVHCTQLRKLMRWSWIAAFKNWNVFATFSKVTTKSTAKKYGGIDNSE